ncbi:ATP-dependent zinc metalloprotease FtsH [Platanthera guangdongensis]|uniref:ATP-dependent zinc metalloprotease FtsH n=1 Tax=Platanthera guangdongensis TaxID=2320717 RepID=A0ABR2N5L1_9ASPA
MGTSASTSPLRQFPKSPSSFLPASSFRRSHPTLTKYYFMSSAFRATCLKVRMSKWNPHVISNDEASSTVLAPADSNEDEGFESARLLEKLKNAEQERVDKLEKFENKANLQLERQLVMASCWSRSLLTLQGKLKGTEWDPENSHSIDFSDFWSLLNSNNVHFMEYSNFGQTVSVILPYYRDVGGGKAHGKEVLYRRHTVDRMPIDAWNEVWDKLHQQLVNVDVFNVDSVSAEVYSTIATAVVWTMRFTLSVAVYLWIDSVTRPIYSKLIPCDLGTPQKPMRQPLKRRALGSLGKSRAKFISAEETTGVTFDDFAGQEYIKRELQEIVRILKNDEEFQDKGIYCPKGVLLHGPPGVAASRVKDLFASARSFAPSIIFIDEIDAIGSKRGGPDIGGGGAEREQGLLQILTEMDGFKESTSQVLVIGATNRLDILDPALLRKGRFDKIIRVGLPSRDGRLAILQVHARNKFFKSEPEKDALLQEIAELAVDFTGAELQNILNEAGILTARKDKDFIEREELLEALKRQKGTFETGQEDSTSIPEDLKIRVIEEEMFGIDNLSWISAKATSEASRRAEFLILQTGMTAFGEAYYRNLSDLVPNLAAKLEALRSEYIRFAIEKCSSVLNEYHSAVETITGMESQMSYSRRGGLSLTKFGAYTRKLHEFLRWGIHGVSLPGRVTFAPGNVGFSTFGAPRPMETQIISDQTWKLIDGIWNRRMDEIKKEAMADIEEDSEVPQLLLAGYFI